jgi:LSD1 subclass zinc finger protein
MGKIFPVNCPSCRALLHARRFECPTCNTVVEGDFVFPVLGRLAEDEQIFVQHLIKCSGSLKDLAKLYDVSYPTVRNRLDALIERVKSLETERPDEV